MSKVVLVADNIRSRSLKALARKLSERLGYVVYRVTPACVRKRHPVVFLRGIDKVGQFERFAQVEDLARPLYATNLAGVSLLPSKRVVIRALTTASQGRGITIVLKEHCNIEAPLYTEYIPKKKEFRVHVWDDEVIDVQQKKKRDDFDGEHNTQVRNLAGGYVFCRDDVVVPDDCKPLALAAVSAIGRHYGAVDIIWNKKQNKCFVLEVNSRPGMEGKTLDIYADAIIRSLQ